MKGVLLKKQLLDIVVLREASLLNICLIFHIQMLVPRLVRICANQVYFSSPIIIKISLGRMGKMWLNRGQIEILTVEHADVKQFTLQFLILLASISSI